MRAHKQRETGYTFNILTSTSAKAEETYVTRNFAPTAGLPEGSYATRLPIDTSLTLAAGIKIMFLALHIVSSVPTGPESAQLPELPLKPP